MIRRLVFVFCLTIAMMACATDKQYMKDWQSADQPTVAKQVVTLDRYPKAGRAFEVRRIYRTNRDSRWNRRTPPEGYIETLKVADDKGRLEFWRDGKRIHTIWLGECFSFASMDENHNFAAQGKSALFTAPTDCKLWDGREWHQTYRTLVQGWVNPCVYEAKRVARFIDTGEGKPTVIRSESTIHMTMEKNGRTHDWKDWVEYDVNLRFPRAFNVGYIGTVQVIKEL